MSENISYSQIKAEMNKNEEVFTTVFDHSLKCIALIDQITGRHSYKDTNFLNTADVHISKLCRKI